MFVQEIWNAALAAIPHDRQINSLDEDTTEAKRCRDAWDMCRKSVIASAEWGWLTEQESLYSHISQVHSGLYEYPKPVGAVRVIGLFDSMGRRIQAQSVGSYLASRYRASFIRYIPDNEDTENWPSWFTDAVIYELAYRIVGAITGSSQLQKTLEAKAIMALNKAKQIDAQEIQFSGTDGKTYAKSRTRNGYADN